MTTEKQPIEGVSPIKNGDFQPAMLVFGSVKYAGSPKTIVWMVFSVKTTLF